MSTPDPHNSRNISRTPNKSRHRSAYGNRNKDENPRQRRRSHSRIGHKETKNIVDTGFENNPFDKIFDLINNRKKEEFLQYFATIKPFIEKNKEISNTLLNLLIKQVNRLKMNSEEYSTYSIHLYQMRKIINSKQQKELIIFPGKLQDISTIINSESSDFSNKSEYYHFLYNLKLKKMFKVFSDNLINILNSNLKNKVKIKELAFVKNRFGIVFVCEQSYNIPYNTLVLFKQIKSELFFYGMVLQNIDNHLIIEICPSQQFELSPKIFSNEEYYCIISDICFDVNYKSTLFLSQPPKIQNLDNLENKIINKNISKLNINDIDSMLKASNGFWIISGQPGCGKTTFAQQILSTLTIQQITSKNPKPLLVLCYSTKSILSFFSKYKNITYKIYHANHVLDELLDLVTYYDKIRKIINSLNIIEKQEYVLSLTSFMNYDVIDEKLIKYFNEEQERKQDSNFYDWLLCNWDKKKWRCQYEHKAYKFQEECNLRYIESKTHLVTDLKKFEGKNDTKSTNALGRITNKLEILNWALKSKPNIDVSPLLQRNLWDLNPFEKWQIYRHWIENLKITLWMKLIYVLKTIKEKNETHIKDKMYMLIEDMKQQKVIGLTFLSAIYLQDALRCMEFSNVCIDDADLLEESDMNAFKGIWDKLFLFGTETLVQNDSLFSRIALDKKIQSLDLQRRMRPKFTELFKGLFVRPVKSSQSLNQVSMIWGLDDPYALYLYKDQNKGTPSNEYEGSFLIGFSLYLLRQGHHPQDLTLITMNSKDVCKLREIAQKCNLHPSISIYSIEEFHGLENEVILISLGTADQCNERFILSALTRARQGLYIIGEQESALKEPYGSIFNLLKLKTNTVNGFPLKCRMHGVKWFAKVPDDFEHTSGHAHCIY